MAEEGKILPTDSGKVPPLSGMDVFQALNPDCREIEYPLIDRLFSVNRKPMLHQMISRSSLSTPALLLFIDSWPIGSISAIFLCSGIAPHYPSSDKVRYVNLLGFSNAILLQV